MSATAVTTIYCEYCNDEHVIGYIYTSPQVKNIDLVGASFTCPKAHAESERL